MADLEAIQAMLTGLPAVSEVTAAFDDACREAMDKAGRLLSVRARSQKELRDRLAEAGFEPEVVERTVNRLVDLRLLDDTAFARQWVDERLRHKGIGPRALRSELRAKGISTDTIDEILTEIDEETHAGVVAARLYRKIARRPLPEQGPRLYQLLLAKGFSPEAAEDAVRAVLPPEDWD